MGAVPRPPTDLEPAAAERAASQVEVLEAKLRRSERRLHVALAEIGATTHGLQTSNADRRTLVEELRAANEELALSETELQAMNAALSDRVDQLAAANSDLRSVIDSTQIAIIFLDDDLRIRNFTPAVQQIVHIRHGDRGRKLTDLALHIGYPGMAADLRRVLTNGETIERPAAHGHSGARYLVRLLPHRGGDERVAGVVLTFVDVTASAQAEQALRASEERFRMMAAAVPALLFIAAADGALTYVNPPYYALTGQPEDAALGDGWLAVLHPDDLEPARRLWRAARIAAATMEQEARLRRADGGWRWFLIRAVPQLDVTGAVVRWYGSCTDIDDRRRVEARQGLLLVQLQHRIKNILAVVRSVLTRTLESSSDLDHFAGHLAGRIGALARTQGVSARTAEGTVMLEDLVYQEVAAHGGQDERQISVDGPPVSLPAKTADSIGLAIHELATNSIKYGALAVAAGRVTVRWRLDVPDEGVMSQLNFEWVETGVPLTDLQPRRRGFGRELIEQGLPYEVGAETSMEFRPGGLRCTIVLPLFAADQAVAAEDMVGERKPARGYWV